MATHCTQLFHELISNYFVKYFKRHLEFIYSVKMAFLIYNIFFFNFNMYLLMCINALFFKLETWLHTIIEKIIQKLSVV